MSLLPSDPLLFVYQGEGTYYKLIKSPLDLGTKISFGGWIVRSHSLSHSRTHTHTNIWWAEAF